MVRTNIEYNGVTRYFNWMDVRFQKKYIAAAEAFGKDIDKINIDNLDDAGEVAALEAQARAAEKFIDKSFGEGTFEKLFGDRQPMDEIYDFIKCCIELKIEQIKAFDEQSKSINALAAEMLN